MTEETHKCSTMDEEAFEIKGYNGAVMVLIVKPAHYILEISFCPFCGKKFHEEEKGYEF